MKDGTKRLNGRPCIWFATDFEATGSAAMFIAAGVAFEFVKEASDRFCFYFATMTQRRKAHKAITGA